MKNLLFTLLLFVIAKSVIAQHKVAWEIGRADNSCADMALAPTGYNHFLSNDFGWEDKYYLIGFSNPKKDWPYVLPGPKDSWAGSGSLASIRTQVLNILFGIVQLPVNDSSFFTVNILGYNGSLPPLVKILINGKSFDINCRNRILIM